MDFELNEEIRAIRDMASKFAQREILPRVVEGNMGARAWVFLRTQLLPKRFQR